MKKQKYLNLGSKLPYLGIFGQQFQKTTVMFEISALEFVKNESLTHTMNFGVGSTFSKGLGPGPGPPYKVCLYLVTCSLCIFKYF